MRRLVPLAFLLAPSVIMAQQTVLRLAPPAGQVSRYAIETDMQFGMGPMSMGATSRMIMTATVTAAEGDERVLETVVDSFTMDAPGMPLGGMQNLAGTTTTVRMTTRGHVIETVYSDPSLTAQFGGMSGPAGQSFPAGVTLPEDAISPGHTWSDSSVVDSEAGPMGTATVTTRARYTFESVERRAGARIAVISIDGTISQSAGAMMADGTITGRMEFDLDAGRWVSNAVRVEMEMDAGGQTGSMTIAMSGSLID